MLSYVLWPALAMYLGFGTRTRVVVRAKGGIVVVQGWLDNDEWGLPGGGVHRGEDLTAAAVRELREETGIDIHAEACRYLDTRALRRYGTRVRYAFFVVDLAQQPELSAQPHEIVAVRWASPSELEALRYKQDVSVALELLAAQV